MINSHIRRQRRKRPLCTNTQKRCPFRRNAFRERLETWVGPHTCCFCRPLGVAVTTSVAEGVTVTGVTPIADKDIGTPGIIGAAVQGVGTAPVTEFPSRS